MALMPDLATMGLEPEDENDTVAPLPDEEDEEAVSAKLEEAMLLNQQLKAMMLAAEEAERESAMMRRGQQRGGGPRPMVDTRRQGGPMQRGAAPSGTGRAPIGTAKNGGWGGQTHTDGRAREINRDNAILVQKLSNIAVERRKPGGSTGASTQQPFRIAPEKTSVSINRRRKDDQIARENAAMARRLNSVKPTAALSAKAAQQHSAKHTGLLRVLGSQGRPGQLPVSSQRARSAAGSRQSTLPQLRIHTDGPRGFEF